MKFTDDKELKKICLYSSEKHCHGIKHIPKTYKNKEGQLPCALCQKDKTHRKTSTRCATCFIPLCTKTFKTENKNCNSHFTKWHIVVDLVREHKRCYEKPIEIRRAGSRYKDDDDDDDSDHDDDDGDNS